MGAEEHTDLFRSHYDLRRVFGALCANFGLPVAGLSCLTFGSFRPGGATWPYRQTDSPETVRFDGRWASAQMLEIYIQEVGAASLVPSLDHHVRERLFSLAAAAPAALAAATALLRSPPPAPALTSELGEVDLEASPDIAAWHRPRPPDTPAHV